MTRSDREDQRAHCVCGRQGWVPQTPVYLRAAGQKWKFVVCAVLLPVVCVWSHGV